MYKHAYVNDVDEIFWNADCGRADAGGALGYTIKATIERGVIYKEGEMACLLLDISRSYHGVRLKDEGELVSEKVLLCTGAYITRLLADSAPGWRELQINGRMIPTGVVAAYVRLTPRKWRNSRLCQRMR